MDDLKSFAIETISTIKYRFNNPLVVSFIISWIVWNFRIVFVFIADGGGWREKINYIYLDLMYEWWKWPVNGILVPFIISLLWIYCLPKLFRQIIIENEKQKRLTKLKVYRIKREDPITEEERRKTLNLIINEKSKFNEERDKANKAIEELNYLLKDANEKILKNDKDISVKLKLISSLESRIQELEHISNKSEIKIEDSFFKSPLTYKNLLSEIGFIFSHDVDKNKSVLIFPMVVKRSVFYGKEKIFNENQIINKFFAIVLINAFRIDKVEQRPVSISEIKSGMGESFAVSFKFDANHLYENYHINEKGFFNEKSLLAGEFLEKMEIN